MGDGLVTAWMAVGLVANIILIRIFGLSSLRGWAGVVLVIGFPARKWLLDTSGWDRALISHAAAVDNLPNAAFAYGVGSFVMLVAMTGLHRNGAEEPGRASRVGANQGHSVGGLLAVAGVLLGTQVVLLSREFGGAKKAFDGLSRRTFTDSASGLATNLSLAALVFIVAASLASAGGQSGRRNRMASLLSLLVVLPWLAIVNGRASVVVAVLALLIARGPTRDARLGARAIQFFFLGAVVVLVSIVGLAWRSASQGEVPFVGEVVRYSSDSLLIVSDALPLLDHAIVGLEYANLTGWSGWSPLLAALVVLVPRPLFTALFGVQKPLYMPQLIADRFSGDALSGLPAGLIGEGWVAFGLFGVVLYSALFSLGMTLLERRMHRCLGVEGRSLLAVMASMFMVVGLRTGLQGGLIALQIIALISGTIVFVLQILHHERTKHKSHSSQMHGVLLRAGTKRGH